MEREKINKLKKIFGENFIGPEELQPFFYQIGVTGGVHHIPEIHYSMNELRNYAHDYILILGFESIGGMKISIEMLRDCFGINPEITEPCFYNQDWYVKEDFVKRTLTDRWYLLRKEVLEQSRGIQPEQLLKNHVAFPSAILCAYTFFAYYFFNKKLLWEHDFVWCEDLDHNGDRVYVGKYTDGTGMNKSGFSVHRHLALRDCYASVTIL